MPGGVELRSLTYWPYRWQNCVSQPQHPEKGELSPNFATWGKPRSCVQDALRWLTSRAMLHSRPTSSLDMPPVDSGHDPASRADQQNARSFRGASRQDVGDIASREDLLD